MMVVVVVVIEAMAGKLMVAVRRPLVIQKETRSPRGGEFQHFRAIWPEEKRCSS